MEPLKIIQHLQIVKNQDYIIKENSWLAKVAAKKLGKQKVAMVLGNRIHLCNTTKTEFLENTRWVNHELCHVAQFKKYGFVNFIFRYLWESLRSGYYNNKYEVEARQAEHNLG